MSTGWFSTAGDAAGYGGNAANVLVTEDLEDSPFESSCFERFFPTRVLLK